MLELQIETIGGNCPVQAEGTLNGKRFYFRARGSSWSFSVGDDPIGAPEWQRQENWGDGPFAAGWMDIDEAQRLINECAQAFTQEIRATGVPQVASNSN